MSVPKAWERETVKAFRRKYPTAFVEKNPDKQYQKSPPDVIVNAGHANYLIECKTRKVAKGTGSIRYDRLEPHQARYLLDYEKIGPSNFGMVGVMFYNAKRGHGKLRRAWLIPIEYWMDCQRKGPRKSLKMDRIALELPGYELKWIPNEGWQLPEWM